VPPGAIAAVANVTVVTPLGSGYLTVYPDGSSSRPTISDLNYAAGQVIPNRVTATLATSDCATTQQVCGKIDVYSSQAANVIVDISGYYTAPNATLNGAIFTPEPAPLRVCDTRVGNPSGLSGPAAQCNGPSNQGMALGPGKTVTVQIGSQFGVPGGATAAVMNVTAVSPTQDTYLTVYPGGSRPTSSDLNPPAKGIEPNLVVATLSATGSFTVFNAGGTVDIIVDLTGWYLAVPAPPSGLSAVPALSQVALNWTAPVSPGTAPISGYNVFEGTSPGGESSTPVNGSTFITTTNYTVTGLASGTTYYFTVKAVNAVGDSLPSNEASGTPGPPLLWRAGGSPEKPVEQWTSLSCPTAGFCAAVGDTSGDAAVYQKGAWSTPDHIDTQPPIGLDLVSCASSSLCVAVDQSSGGVFTYDGTAWSRDPAAPAPPLVAVSCTPGAGLCMLMNNTGTTYTSGDGVSWRAAGALPNITSQLACLSSTSCLALLAVPDASGTAVASYTLYTWNGTSWSPGASLPSTVVTDSLDSFSCSSATLCVVLLTNPVVPVNLLYAYDGTAWSSSSLPAGYSPQGALACAPGSECFTIGLSSTAGSGFFDYASGFWAAVPNGTQGAFAASANELSCGSASFCAAIPGGGDLGVFNGTSWTAAPVGGSTEIESVSCATSIFCAAVDNGGGYLTFDGISWSSPAALKDSTHAASPFSGPGAISCPTVGACTAIDSTGNVWRYSAGSWSLLLPAAGGIVSGSFPEDAISCATTDFCAIVFGAGAATYDAATATWTPAPAGLDSNKSLDSVSCTGNSFCIAVDQAGSYTTWNGASWSAVGRFASAGSSESVSCSTSSLCVAAGGDGNAETYNGTVWSNAVQVAASGTLGNPSCVPASGSLPAYCVVSGSRSVYYVESLDGVSTWSAGQTVPDNSGDSILTLSCARSLCVATGVQNHAWEGTP
jgi:hypothetical protein